MSQQQKTDAMPPKPKRPNTAFVCVGQIVLWHPHGNVVIPPVPARVCAVGEKTLDLMVDMPDSGTSVVKQGVYHAHEPGINVYIREESGGWQHTELTNRLYSANARLGKWADELAVPAEPEKTDKK